MNLILKHAPAALAALSLNALSAEPTTADLKPPAPPALASNKRDQGAGLVTVHRNEVPTMAALQHELRHFISAAHPPTPFVIQANLAISALERITDPARRPGELSMSETDRKTIHDTQKHYLTLRDEWTSLSRLEYACKTLVEQAGLADAPGWLKDECKRASRASATTIQRWRAAEEWLPSLKETRSDLAQRARIVENWSHTRSALDKASAFSPQPDRAFAKTFQASLQQLIKDVQAIEAEIARGPVGESLQSFADSLDRKVFRVDHCSLTFDQLNSNPLALHQRYEEGTRERIVSALQSGVSIIGGFVALTFGLMLWQSIRDSRERADRFFPRKRADKEPLSDEQRAKITHLWPQ